MNDTYLSVIRALEHAACSVGRKLKTRFINSTDLEDPDADDDARARAAAVFEVLDQCDGILVPGGFGVRGVEGKLRAVKFARENKKPFLGSVCTKAENVLSASARPACSSSARGARDIKSFHVRHAPRPAKKRSDSRVRACVRACFIIFFFLFFFFP